mgnify:CR=1 FL=1
MITEFMNIPRKLTTSFSTADADFPEIHQIDGDLIIRFKDWQELNVGVFFADPIAFKWQMADNFYKGERDDCCYEIIKSSWISEHIKQGEISETEEYHHYKFNFNTCGQLEVLAISYTEIDSSKDDVV